VNLTWIQDPDGDDWDRELAELGGHPLQSALWGSARQRADGIEDQRWSALAGGHTVFMARCEVRHIARIARVAWIPRGPVSGGHEARLPAFLELLEHLRATRCWLCIDDRYQSDMTLFAGAALPPAPRTAMIDLSVGHERVWARVDPKVRYSVRHARQAGVVIEQTRDEQHVSAFFALCQQISRLKRFELSGSLPLLRLLLAPQGPRGVEARLFVARLGAELVAGALVIQSGRSRDYLWGGVDRRFTKLRAGEAVQGAVIDWALARGIHRYDLEGIDRAGNPGTYQFKMKLGADELELPGRRAYPLTLAGRAALAVGQWTGRL
jgi:hypothetical protein